MAVTVALTVPRVAMAPRYGSPVIRKELTVSFDSAGDTNREA